MLFTVGTKVRFKHTEDEGVVRALLDGGMVSVYLPSEDMEIPAYTEDLVRASEYQRYPVKAKIVAAKKEKEEVKPPPIPIETQYAIIKSQGVQLAFEALFDRNGLVEKYLIHLLNDTQYEVVFSIRFLLNYRSPLTWQDRLKPVSWVQLGEMLYDDLNEAPEFEVECRWGTTEGLGEPVYKSLKIKAKSFFNSQRTAPLINKTVHLFRLFEKPEPLTSENEDLQAYTKRHAKPSWQTSVQDRFFNIHDTRELAEFEPEIDLHIDKLTDNWQKMSSSEIIRLQMSHFEKFISKAIRLGVPGVFVIHGVGEGKLRDAIATSLMNNPDVETFKNEYHHRYGWGATEVIF
jgi:hypothetical protein